MSLYRGGSRCDDDLNMFYKNICWGTTYSHALQINSLDTTYDHEPSCFFGPNRSQQRLCSESMSELHRTQDSVVRSSGGEVIWQVEV